MTTKYRALPGALRCGHSCPRHSKMPDSPAKRPVAFAGNSNPQRFGFYDRALRVFLFLFPVFGR